MQDHAIEAHASLSTIFDSTQAQPCMSADNTADFRILVLCYQLFNYILTFLAYALISVLPQLCNPRFSFTTLNQNRLVLKRRALRQQV